MMRQLPGKSGAATPDRPALQHESRPGRAGGDEGWALLGLILALAILGILLSSSVVPNVQFQVQRDKEAEMIYRGNVMAEAIARYYNLGNRGAPVQLVTPMPYGSLTDLKKLRDGVTIGVNEIKFIRASALIDPMTGVEWEPVRARDPRIMKVLQAYAALNQVPIPIQLLSIAAPPSRASAFAQGSTNFPAPGSTNQTGASGSPSTSVGGVEDENAPEEDEDSDDEDEDSDDEDEPDVIEGATGSDPLAHLFQ
ncbi:MAG TPA: hypothetical protein VNH22_00005, partial [Blastocatellia bacterium]|nr:hypothetical protein [Blastocatellia bacterium]